jgi:hypothetical protein
MKTSKPSLFLAALLIAPLAAARVTAFLQEPSQQTNFFDVTLGPEEICKYTNLRFTGDYISFESPSGALALGRTEAGVTVVIVLGGGTLSLDVPEAAQEKFTEVFKAHPLKTAFKTIYMRLNPKEFDETFATQEIVKSPDEQALAAAKQIYADRFLTSFHAGEKAIFPPYKTRILDVETADFGMITYEEGYWIRLRRLSPYASIYPRDFLNPKQK